MNKIVFLFVILMVMFAIPVAAQSVDVALGVGHLQTGAGDYLCNVSHRDFTPQLEVKWVSANGLGAYGGYTQDGYKLVTWLNKHNFMTREVSDMKRLKALDLGVLYMLKAEKLDGWVAGGGAFYDSLGQTSAGWFLAVGVDIQVYKSLFATVKAEWRSHCTDFKPMQASAFETGLLIGWRF